ncbi:hypothetical protein D3C85_1013680 [compost metagenome]
MVAIEGDDGTDRDARRFHVDQQEADALLLLGRAVGAYQDKAPVGVMSGGGPQLLAVKHVVVAIAHRGGSQRRQVGTRARLGEALAEPVVHVRHARQEMLLLLLRAEGDQHRADHVHVEGDGLRRRRHVQLLLEDVVLGGAPGLATPLRRPGGTGPALGVQDPHPAHHLFLGQALTELHLAANLRRYGTLQEGTDFVTKGQFLRGESQFHYGFLSR